ncbi:hypothetical protein ACTFIW_012099 [Dictyostelium discoideum]
MLHLKILYIKEFKGLDCALHENRFFWTPQFAASFLEHLIDNSPHEIVGIVSKPDKPRGRDLKLISTEVEKGDFHSSSVPLVKDGKKAFSFQSNQAALSHSNKEKNMIIGLEEQGLLQTCAIDADPSTPIGAVLQGILLHPDIDRLEICDTKRIGSLLHKLLILPRKKMKTAVFEELNSGQIFRFDIPLHARKFELLYYHIYYE